MISSMYFMVNSSFVGFVGCPQCGNTGMTNGGAADRQPARRIFSGRSIRRSRPPGFRSRSPSRPAPPPYYRAGDALIPPSDRGLQARCTQWHTTNLLSCFPGPQGLATGRVNAPEVGSPSWPRHVEPANWGGAITSSVTSASWPVFRRLENICQQGVRCHTPLTRTTATLGTLDSATN